jgi:hypothetical protein
LSEALLCTCLSTLRELLLTEQNDEPLSGVPEQETGNETA